jgi:hypothetical protein
MRIFYKAIAFFMIAMLSNVVFANVVFVPGRHYPNGNVAVQYIYGPDGMFRQINNLEYQYDFYDRIACPNGTRLIDQNLSNQYSLTHQTTSPSADCHLLLDLNQDGELDFISGGSAFQEHYGIGIQGTQSAAPVQRFWFDDNWLARYMANAYNRPEPFGLYITNSFNRYAIIGGDTTNWRAYPENQFLDHIAFNGLYDVAVGNTASAVKRFNTWLGFANATYDSTTRQYKYTASDNYQIGQFRYFIEQLLRFGSRLTADQRRLLIQHSVSLRADIINRQIVSGNAPGGWVTSRDANNNNSLVNTETIAFQVLGLGAGGQLAFEAGQSPMLFSQGSNFSYNAVGRYVTATAGASRAGTLLYGPYWQFPVGDYTVAFYTRAPNPVNNIATIDVYDSVSNTALAGRGLVARDFNTNGNWSIQYLSFRVTNPSNNLQFRVGWSGVATMDVAFVQIL